jgi:folate-dependent phosphoribosylglycinamide formyltransferase PurN
MPLKIAVCVSGGGSNLLALLESLRNFGGAKVGAGAEQPGERRWTGHAKAFGVPAVVFRNPADDAEWLERSVSTTWT